MQNFEDTWELYTSSWKATTAAEKKSIYKHCLSENCEYNDPLIKTKGWDELSQYMLDFHLQIPGGHFVSTYFLAHNDQSITKWQMRDGADNVVGEGISYGQYDQDGKLSRMTGFFETPAP